MTNQIDTSEEWRLAGVTLVEAIRVELEKGAMGVQEYMDVLRPLWLRYQQGDRTDDLLNKIKALEKTKSAKEPIDGK